MFSARCQAHSRFLCRTRRYFLSALLVSGLAVCPASAAVTRSEFESGVRGTLSRIAKEAASAEGAVLVSDMIQREYGAPAEEIRWAREHELSWGTTVAYAYVRATTGQGFAELDRSAVEKDFWAYTESAGMSADKMVHSLDQFLKRVETERNTRIFERIRANRRVLSMPDLGSGFGLLQEALDFRRLEAPRPTKIHPSN